MALGIETDLVSPVPRAAFERRSAVLARYVRERLAVAAQDARCAPTSPAVDYSRLPDDVNVVLRYDCAVPVERLHVAYGLFFDLDPTHRSLGRVRLPGGREVPFVFDRSLTILDLEIGRPAAPQAWPARFGRVLRLGAEHILLGWDHLLFLLALLVAAASFWRMARIVTAFTVAHSLTLALAWYGILTLPPRLVETAIAASIAYVAVENVAGRGAGHRWLVAGAFGLVHGLGFYAALRELGLEGTDALTTLLAFNLGVEAGQVAVVAVAWGPLVMWARQPWHRLTARIVSAAVLVLAISWTIERALAR